MMHFPKLSVCLSVCRGFHPSDCTTLDVGLSRSFAVKPQHMSPLESIRARFKLAQVLVSLSALPLKMQHLMSIMAWTHTPAHAHNYFTF